VLASTDPAKDAWLIAQLVTSAFHHYAFAGASERVEDIVEHLWTFCLAAVGGRPAGRGRTDGRRTGIREEP
jgi:hypothetical protein